MREKQERIFQPQLFKQYLKSKFISLLDSIAGRKLLMLQPAARIPINIIIQRKTLWQHQIPEDKGIRVFQIQKIDDNFDQIVVILSPTVQNLKKFRDLVKKNIQASSYRKFYPVFWPKRTTASTQFFKNSDILQYIQVKDFSFDLLPLDIDLYSLQMPRASKQLYIDQNLSVYASVAQSIHRLQCVFGRIHNIFGKGRAAKSIYQMIKLKQVQIKLDQNYGDIQTLIIFDRQSDFLTPLLKQITYQGLIDEFFGISGSVVSRIPSPQDPKKMQNIQLNSQKDHVYKQIRSLSVNGAGNVLNNIAQQFQNFLQKARQIKDINQKSSAVKKISADQMYIKRHLNLKNLITQQMKTISFHKQLMLHQRCILQNDRQIADYFQSMIAFQQPLPKILRSLCLQSIVDKGISKKVYNRICQDIVLTYGGQHIISLTNLSKLGLFYQKGTKQNPYLFNQIKKQLRLISDDPINHQNPQDTSFAYGGYTPIFTRLVQLAIRSSWRNVIPAIKLIPGQIIIPSQYKQCRSHPKPAVVVYFVGGVTYSQVATLRLLSKLLNKQIIIATTHMINGQSMISGLLQPLSVYS